MNSNIGSTGTLDPQAMNAVATEVLESCALQEGKLTLADDVFLAFSTRIQQAEDKRGWGTALIALAQRLRSVPGAGPAAERVLALAAVALGDKELNSLVTRAARS